MPSHAIVHVTIITDPLLAVASVNYNPTGFSQQTLSDSSMITSNLYKILTIRPFYKRLVGPINQSLEEINKALPGTISNHTLYIFTDGSYNPSVGTGAHGWVLATTKTKLWSGTGPSDDHPQLTDGSIHMYCNCEKAVWNNTSISYKGIADYLEPNSDFLHEARLLYKKCSVTLSPQWVKGHSTGKNLTIAQELNQQAHKLTYNSLKNPKLSFSPSSKVLDPPSGSVLISFDASTLT
jgi:ribonuclease HI